MNFTQTNANAGDVVNTPHVNHAKLLYVLERIRARSARGDVFHTYGVGSDCHAECCLLEADGLVQRAGFTDGANHTWEVVK